jgi:hypothetical protein
LSEKWHEKIARAFCAIACATLLTRADLRRRDISALRVDRTSLICHRRLRQVELLSTGALCLDTTAAIN